MWGRRYRGLWLPGGAHSKTLVTVYVLRRTLQASPSCPQESRRGKGLPISACLFSGETVRQTLLCHIIVEVRDYTPNGCYTDSLACGFCCQEATLRDDNRTELLFQSKLCSSFGLSTEIHCPVRRLVCSGANKLGGRD
jgi:hypothetical protein